MRVQQLLKNPWFWNCIIAMTVAGAIYSTVLSLTHWFFDIFPFLYFFPIILFVYFHPKRGVQFSLLLSTMYFAIVYYYGYSDPKLIAVSVAWFTIFITVGVVTSSFALSFRDQERKYQQIFENSQAGIFTFDCKTLLISNINDKCASMLRYEREDLVDKDLSIILPASPERELFLSNLRERSFSGEVELVFHNRGGAARQFLITATTAPEYTAICSAIDITERKLAEKMIRNAKEELEGRVRERTSELLRTNDMLRTEIQERKRYEDAIELANKKLNTLSSITRHDILNQITALGMFLSLAKEIATDPVVIDHLNNIEQITLLIQKQIRFTRDYQNIGTSSPHWQRVQRVIDNAITDLHFGKAALEADLNDLEIYADLLLEKVFFNLLENSIRHGGVVTKIRFYFRRDESGVTIIYEDNGVGIPSHAKEKIFKREYYRNTGYGLFLVAEILGITGLSIKENGEPGKGARFEIFVPPGAFRFAHPLTSG
jgi:PAS domain S-box-containing protein